MSVQVQLRGFDELRQFVRGIPERVDEASSVAINDTLKFGQAESSRRIRKEIAFSASYIGSAENPSSRLAVSRKASPQRLEGAITGRARATSLARFKTGEKKGRNGKKGYVRVKVKAGGAARSIPGAFTIKLRRGNAAYDPGNGNEGIAVRLKDGELPEGLNKKKMVQIEGSLYLLYGPSVDQIFRKVREDVAPILADKVGDNFVRQYDRISRNG